MRLGTCLLYESHTLQGAHPEPADFCSALVADFYAAVDSNLVFEKSAQNFSPMMAMVEHVIVVTEDIVDAGTLDTNQIHTSGLFVDCIYLLEELTSDYGVRLANVN